MKFLLLYLVGFVITSIVHGCVEAEKQEDEIPAVIFAAFWPIMLVVGTVVFLVVVPENISNLVRTWRRRWVAQRLIKSTLDKLKEKPPTSHE